MKSGLTGLIVAAAFIGPGTVTTASMVGAELGYGLVWALIFSIIATCTLQEMSARLGLVTGQGLSEAIIAVVKPKALKWISITLVVAAIGVGNAAYEGGNITGAALGLASVFDTSISLWAMILGALAFLLLALNQYQWLERLLIALVILMSMVFITIMLIAGLDFSMLIDGLSTASGFSNSVLLLAIIGTTIVPYNLFLHAGMSAKDKAHTDLGKPEVMAQHRRALFGSIGIGGLVTFAIMSASANAFYATQTVLSPGNIALQLSPVLGEYAEIFFALGLFSAGLTSALTAPLAAGYAISGLFGWQTHLADKRFKSVCLLVVLIGVLLAVSGVKPLSIIILAQASNAMLLPVSALFLLFVMNQKRIMGEHTNAWISNCMGAVVLCVVIYLGLSKLVF